MATSPTIPAVSFQNDLGYDVIVYDSFTPDTETDAENNYFGQLTQLGKVTASSTGSIQPIHTTSAFIIESVKDEKPVKRVTKMSFQKITSFTVNKADEDVMTATLKFIDFILKNPNDAMSQAFNTILKGDASKLLTAINAFFLRYPDYATCTFQTYMMGITYAAKTPETVAKPAEQATYSLSKLISLLGGTWPGELPDIIVSDFTCNTKNDVLTIGMQLDVSQLPAATPQISQNFASLFQEKKLKATLTINYGISLGIFGTRLTILLDTLKVPVGNGNVIAINTPTITIDINPLFKFVVFTIRGIIPFNIFSKQFNANISMTIDNVEASIQAVIDGDNSSLPAPPVMKGVHFDEFGAGIGIIFEPPAIAIGLQGKFHIGDTAQPGVVQIDDDTFALICGIEGGEIPDPLYISFYIPKMDINTVLQAFTNVNPNLDIPVSFTDLSFKWAENPMEPLTLPDGTLTEMAYGFSAGVNIFSFGFFGDVEIDLNNGLTADVEMSPLSLGNVFTMSGDGKGVTIKVDQNGNPIRNNEIRNTKVLQDALKTATDKQLVTPGGPVLVINTLKSPILHVNAKASLFELVDYGIEADINKDGILFQLDFGGILTEQMTCQLSDFHNFYGAFKFGINQGINLPAIAGVSLGSIQVQAVAAAHVAIKTSLSDVVLSIGGSFDFEGSTRQFGDFSADIHIKKMTDAIGAIIANLEQYAGQIFGDITQDAGKWAAEAKKGLISGYTTVADVLKNAYGKTNAEMTSIMKGLRYTADEVAAGLKNIYNATDTDVAVIMNGAGYTADEVSNCLKDTFHDSINDVAKAMKNAQYTAAQVASTLKDTFNADINQVASAMGSAEYAADQVASSLKNTFNCSVSAVSDAMKVAGYGADQIKNAFESLGGDFSDFAKKALEKLNPSNW